LISQFVITVCNDRNKTNVVFSRLDGLLIYSYKNESTGKLEEGILKLLKDRKYTCQQNVSKEIIANIY
jgi:hypothetical protein